MTYYSKLSILICKTPVTYIPVKIRKGISKGAWFTIYPFSSYWRMGGGEKDVENAICLYCSKLGMTCWDIGAHFGIYTLGMALSVGSEGEVVSFEPDSFSYKKCKYHIKLNNLHWVKLYNVAVSNVNDTDYLLDGGCGESFARLGYDGEDKENTKNKIKVKKIVVDDLVKNSHVKPPDFIKIDIEGHAHKALIGADFTIKKYKPIILISFHSETELNGSKDILQKYGYSCFDCYGKKTEWPESDFCGTRVFV